MISSISSIDIIDIIHWGKSQERIPDSKITESVAGASAVHPNGMKRLLANVLRAFFIKGKPCLSNGLISPQNSPADTILGSWDFDNSILADQLFAKTLQSFGKCLVVNSKLC